MCGGARVVDNSYSELPESQHRVQFCFSPFLLVDDDEDMVASASPPLKRISFFTAPLVNHAPCSFDFLRRCSRCTRSLEAAIDIYMYRGDQAFCSAECRNQQMDVDEQKGRYPSVIACKREDHKESKEMVGHTTVEISG